jgi:DNA-binding transcriptional LysR family regulator
MDWEDVRVFLAVAEAGSLSGAARSLGVNHATIARRLARFDQDLGAPGLLEKRPEGYVLTSAGQAVLEEARAMEAAALAIGRRAEAGEAIAGLVRVSTLASFAEHMLASPLARLTGSHPALEIELVGEDRNISIARGDADLALRFGRPTRGESVTRRVGTVDYGLYAAPDYLDRTAEAEWRFIGYSEELELVAPGARRVAELAAGRGVSLRLSTMGAQREAAAAGGGVALLPRYLAGEDVRLRLAAVDSPAWSQPVWLLMRRDVARVGRVRLVADALIAALEQESRRLTF